MRTEESQIDPSAMVIRPGLPNGLSRPGEGGPFYPSTTLSVFKTLKVSGYPVRLADEKVREVSHHSTDLWLPILEFGSQILAGGLGGVLADVLMRLVRVKPPEKAIVHIRWSVQAADGSTHLFAYDGDAVAAADVASQFEKGLGYGHESDR